MSEKPAPTPAWGEIAPSFSGLTDRRERYAISSAAGRFLLLAFYDTAANPIVNDALNALGAVRHVFDDQKISFFGMPRMQQDFADKRAASSLPGIRFIQDFDGARARIYGAEEAPTFVLLDPQFRIVSRSGMERAQDMANLLRVLPAVDDHAGAPLNAPVLLLPRVFEAELCAALIKHYREAGGVESGFMRDIDGKTREIIDHAHKRRSDVTIQDEKLRQACNARLARRLAPAVKQAFQFQADYVERYLVARYSAEEGGHFGPHRDNTTKGTAHRRFAVTINLNAEGYEGGDLRFPEFGSKLYRAPTGGAVVFSCSLLHQAMPVTKGERFAFLPFLYDARAAEIRQDNRKFIENVARTEELPN